MNYINKLICIVTCFLPYIPYNCNAMHYQQPDDPMSACEQGKRSCKSDDVKPMIFTDLPDHVLRPIAAYLSENDIIQLSRTCTYLHTMVTGSQPHFLVPYIAHSLARKVDNPMQLIRDRRLQAIRDEKNKADAPRIVVHGCTVPASELEAAVADELQESIIDLLTSRELDPIEYVCSESRGASTVTLYGQEFDNTTALLHKMRSLGLCPMRVRMRVREGNGRLTLDSFFNNSDRGGYQGTDSDYYDQPISPSVDGLQVPELFLKSLGAEEQLDYAPWVHVKMDNGDRKALLQRLDKICSERPGVGIWLQVVGEENPGLNGEIGQEFVSKLAKYPITALFIDNVTLPEGSAILSALSHLRVLSISLSDAAINNLFSQELCQLSELRAIQFTFNPDVGAEPTLSVPENLSNLKKLQYMSFHSFRYEGLENLANAPQLHILKLISPESEEVTELPEDICQLPELCALYWGYADFDSVSIDQESIPEDFIPEQIADLDKLIGLKIACSSLVEFCLPRSIGQLKYLRHLDLSQCGITDLPEELRLLASLKHLDLHDILFEFGEDRMKLYNLLYYLSEHNVDILPRVEHYFDRDIELLKYTYHHNRDEIALTSFNIKTASKPGFIVPNGFDDYVEQIMKYKDGFEYLDNVLKGDSLTFREKFKIVIDLERIDEDGIRALLYKNGFESAAKKFYAETHKDEIE